MLLAVVLLLAFASTPLQLGIQALGQKDFKVAVQQLELASEASPGDPNIWVLLAQARFGAGDSEAALAAAAKAEDTGKGDADVHHGLAFLYSEFARDYGKAAEFEAQYARARPADKGAWARVAVLYIRANLPEQAIEPAVTALRADPNPGAQTTLEEAAFRASQKQMVKQDFDGAAATLEKARAVLKDNPQLELSYGVALYAQRKFSQAVAQFLRTMDLAPDVEQSYVFAGKILKHAADRLPSLLERFHTYRKRNPESHLGYLLAAKALTEQGAGADEALALARQAVAKKPDDAEAHLLIGTLLDNRGDFPEAATALERSVALRKGDAATHYRLARVYLKLGRKDDAARERALYEKFSEDEAARP